MKRLFSTSLFVFVLVRASEAEIITVPFSAIVREVVGTPFGIVAQVGVTPVTGSFMYDTTTPPTDMTTNGANFNTNIASGFALNVGGVSIRSSQYVVQATDHVLNFGGSDIFRAVADTDIGDFRANGLQVQGSAEMWLVDTDQTMYALGTDTYIPPTQAQLGHADFHFGYLGDETAGGGSNTHYFVFTTVPEPAPALLVAQALALLAIRRVRQEWLSPGLAVRRMASVPAG
jgi:hypothetical protein